MKPMPELAALLEQGQGEAHLRNQDALVHQAGQRGRHQATSSPSSSTSRGRSSPPASCRSSSRKWTSTARTRPGPKSCSRRPSSRSSNGLPAGQLVMLKLTLPEKDDLYAELVRPSQGREGGRAVGRLHAGGRQPTLAEESRRRGELLAGAGRGAVGPAIRRRVQRRAGRIHSAHLRGVQHVSSDQGEACAVDPRRRLRPLGEQVVGGGAGGGGSHPRRRDGRALRPEPLDGRRRSWSRFGGSRVLPLETHLMVSDPDLFLDEFATAGSDSFLVHWEGNNNLHRTVQRIRALGKRAGVAINPATPAAVLEEIVRGRRSGAGHDRQPGIRSPAVHSDRPCRRSHACAS